MSLVILALVIFSTFCHAYWNMILKKTTGGFFFIWLFTLFTAILYIPYIISISGSFTEIFNSRMLIVCILSMTFHLLYFIFLDKAYKYGELSVIYPLARGIAPVITITIAIIFLGERLSAVQIISVVLIIAGTFILSGFSYKSNAKMLSSLIFALLCGFMVASYTIVDKLAVANYAISPFILDFFGQVGRILVLLPFVSKDTGKLKETASKYWKEALIIAVLSPLSYILILFAMKSAPVSLVSPLRQFSIVIGGILGIRVLCESREYMKLAGITITFLGVILMSF